METKSIKSEIESEKLNRIWEVVYYLHKDKSSYDLEIEMIKAGYKEALKKIEDVLIKFLENHKAKQYKRIDGTYYYVYEFVEKDVKELKSKLFGEGEK